MLLNEQAEREMRDMQRMVAGLRVPLNRGPLAPGDLVRVKEKPKPRRSWNGWNVESTHEGSTDHVIIGAQPRTVLQVRADKDTEVNGIHVRFYDPPFTFRAEIGVVVQEWPVGLRDVPIMPVAGPKLVIARRNFPASRKITPLVMERQEAGEPVPQALWGWIQQRQIVYNEFCLGVEHKRIDRRKFGPPVVAWPQDYWKWVGNLKVFYGKQCLGIVVIANFPCPCKVTISGR